MSLTLIQRPDLGKKAYWLKCRFRIDAYPTEGELNKAKFMAAEEFVKDMRKQDWDWLSEHGFKMTGPYAPVEPMVLPKPHQDPWHIPSKELLAAVQAGYRPESSAKDGSVLTVPLVAECEKWEFELVGAFVHPTILTEVPDEHEEITR